MQTMILTVLKYGHPTLRKRGSRIERITPEIRQLIAGMLETMQEAKGVGLAAQQVGHALQLMVVDVREVADRPSTLQIRGQSVEVNDYMPMVLINPDIKPTAEPVSGPEGCLSFPEIYSDVCRPSAVEVTALNEIGEKVEFGCSGLLARAIQHEQDHLNGILFIDRMTADNKKEIKPQLEDLQAETKRALSGSRG
jgi:peptide deformylase